MLLSSVSAFFNSTVSTLVTRWRVVFLTSSCNSSMSLRNCKHARDWMKWTEIELYNQVEVLSSWEFESYDLRRRWKVNNDWQLTSSTFAIVVLSLNVELTLKWLSYPRNASVPCELNEILPFYRRIVQQNDFNSTRLHSHWTPRWPAVFALFATQIYDLADILPNASLCCLTWFIQFVCQASA